MHIIFMHTDEQHSPSANVLLTQHFNFIHHFPSGSSSQMDLNGHTECPVKGLIALLFLWGITLCSQSIFLKYKLSEKIFYKILLFFSWWKWCVFIPVPVLCFTFLEILWIVEQKDLKYPPYLFLVCCSSGRVGDVLTGRLVVWFLAAPVCAVKYFGARCASVPVHSSECECAWMGEGNMLYKALWVQYKWSRKG